MCAYLSLIVFPLAEFESSSRVYVKLVNFFLDRTSSSPSSSTSQSVDSTVHSPASAKPNDHTSADELARTVIRYHAGWCVVATRRALSTSDTEVLDKLSVFGSDKVSPHKPSLQAFTGIMNWSGELGVGDDAYHTFILREECMPLFTRMHDVAEERFPCLLKENRENAAVRLKQELLSDSAISTLFGSIIKTGTTASSIQDIII